MSDEERLARLEKALAKVAELASKDHERTSDLERSFQILDELVRKDRERPKTNPSWLDKLNG
jgi:hypothetical protein